MKAVIGWTPATLAYCASTAQEHLDRPAPDVKTQEFVAWSRHMSLVLSATASFLLGMPTHAAVNPKIEDPHRIVCVPLRDKRSRPTGAKACRTAA